MSLYAVLSLVIGLAAVFSYVNYRFIRLPTTIGVTLIALVESLLFGALISPTDPIAVLGILRSAAAPKSLEAQIAGEALFNDGVAIAVFSVLLGVAASARGIGGLDVGAVALVFAREIV